MPLFDASRDYKKVKAFLHNDGGRFLVTQPIISFFMIKEVTKVHSLEGKGVYKDAL
jgi:hypothetical protein